MTELHINQRKGNDCAIASLAMLLELPYAQVHACCERLYPEWDGLLYTQAKAIARTFGHKLLLNRLPVADLRGTAAILVVPAIGTPGERHAVYWSGKQVLDPAPHRPGYYRPYGKKGTRALKSVLEIWHLQEA